jgi:hypothetical protein
MSDFGLITITTNGAFGNRHQSFSNEKGKRQAILDAMRYLGVLLTDDDVWEERKCASGSAASSPST